MKRASRGFTIIEVMLFLAVTGVLAAGILASVGSTLGLQRYRDAVDGFSSYIQGQYGQTINVRNDIDNHRECAADGTFLAAHSAPPGTSETCVIIGRLVTTANGQTFRSQPIYMSGVTSAFLKSGIGDDAVFTADAAANRRLLIDSGVQPQTYQLDWGVRTQPPATGDNAWAIAIVRSPISGVIHTYTMRRASVVLDQLVVEGNRRNDSVICIDPSGWLAGQTLGVAIAADAPGASGVVTRTEGCN